MPREHQSRKRTEARESKERKELVPSSSQETDVGGRAVKRGRAGAGGSRRRGDLLVGAPADLESRMCPHRPRGIFSGHDPVADKGWKGAAEGGEEGKRPRVSISYHVVGMTFPKSNDQRNGGEKPGGRDAGGGDVCVTMGEGGDPGEMASTVGSEW